MKTPALLTLLSLLTLSSLPAAEPAALVEPLEVFRPLLGKTWRGVFKNSKPEKPMVDVMKWERALNGKAVRVLHSVNDGVYGGESIIRWDAEKKQIAYHYFTTAGFFTTGTMTHADGKYSSLEKVTGDASGTTEVRATYERRGDGSLLSKVDYFRNGAWTPGREIAYVEDATAEVKFK